MTRLEKGHTSPRARCGGNKIADYIQVVRKMFEVQF